MPINEIAAQVRDPKEFLDHSFRRKKVEDGVDVIIGKTKTGTDGNTVQAYRFKLDKFSPDEAKQWLRDHRIRSMSFGSVSSTGQGE
jgi:hypothetical protein